MLLTGGSGPGRGSAPGGVPGLGGLVLGGSALGGCLVPGVCLVETPLRPLLRAVRILLELILVVECCSIMLVYCNVTCNKCCEEIKCVCW